MSRPVIARSASRYLAAVLAMIQEQTFGVMLNLAEADEADDPGEKLKLMSTAARGMADLTRASIALKKHQRETAERLKAMEADARTGKRPLAGEGRRTLSRPSPSIPLPGGEGREWPPLSHRERGRG